HLMATSWRDLRGQTSYAPTRFTTAVYQTHVAGKPRLAGALAALSYFHVPDAPARAGVYADAKQQRLIELIHAGKSNAYPEALRVVSALRGHGLRLAAASSSKNANMLLSMVQIDHEPLLRVFDANVCGRDFAHGKPDPEIFAAAGVELQTRPEQIVVVEDAPSGIEAAKRAAMAALGVARHQDRAGLVHAGADLVVDTLDAVDVVALSKGWLRRSDGAS
ncbi:MAG: HAD-IA family hydrolase, partial [Chloroflexi bacterium]|nr:HAD-IA family hydrolase [Chloroflexota bacterium]